jgi:hypothetical protein
MLVSAIDPQAVQSPDWPALAVALSRACHAGLDVDEVLPGLLVGRQRPAAPVILERLIEQADRVTATPANQFRLDRAAVAEVRIDDHGPTR